jgi:hypothetical protein
MCRQKENPTNERLLRAVMAYRGETVKSLAHSLYLEPNSLSAKIRGERQFYANEIIKIKNLLGMSVVLSTAIFFPKENEKLVYYAVLEPDDDQPQEVNIAANQLCNGDGYKNLEA